MLGNNYLPVTPKFTAATERQMAEFLDSDGFKRDMRQAEGLSEHLTSLDMPMDKFKAFELITTYPQKPTD